MPIFKDLCNNYDQTETQTGEGQRGVITILCLPLWRWWLWPLAWRTSRSRTRDPWSRTVPALTPGGNQGLQGFSQAFLLLTFLPRATRKSNLHSFTHTSKYINTNNMLPQHFAHSRRISVPTRIKAVAESWDLQRGRLGVWSGGWIENRTAERHVCWSLFLPVCRLGLHLRVVYDSMHCVDQCFTVMTCVSLWWPVFRFTVMTSASL